MSRINKLRITETWDDTSSQLITGITNSITSASTEYEIATAKSIYDDKLWEEGSGVNSAKLISQSNIVYGENTVAIGDNNLAGVANEYDIITVVSGSTLSSITISTTDLPTPTPTEVWIDNRFNYTILSITDNGDGTTEIVTDCGFNCSDTVGDFTFGENLGTSNDFVIGSYNEATGGYSFAGGNGSLSFENKASGVGSFVFGYDNEATGDGSVVLGSKGSISAGAQSAIIGGYNNSTDPLNKNSFIGGGENNEIQNGGGSPINNSILAGNTNIITSTAVESSIIGGNINTVSGSRASIICGSSNIVSGLNCVVIGGTLNEVSDTNSVIIGGSTNEISKSFGSIIGGYNNTLSAEYSVILGGIGITATQNNMVYVPALMLSTQILPPSPEAGTIYFDGTNFLGYDGTTWKQLDN